MRIVVESCGWGMARPVDIEVLLKDAASHLSQLLRNPFRGTVAVVPAPRTDPIPRAHIRSHPGCPFRIQLTARDTRWAQFAYQFSHEFCHVLSNYEHLQENPNNWFHETICELASVFTLRRMAERWLTHPPYPHWTDYARELARYVEECLSHKKRQLPAGMTLSTWLLSEEEGLRKDRYLRDKNAVVAYSLLPIFEDDPAGWNAICSLPDSSAMFRDYLIDWHSQVEPVDKPFVTRISDAFD